MVRNIRKRQYPSNTNNLFIIRLATCFDPTGSLSGLHYEPLNVKKLRTFLGSQTMFTIVKYERIVSNGLHTVIFFLYISKLILPYVNHWTRSFRI